MLVWIINRNTKSIALLKKTHNLLQETCQNGRSRDHCDRCMHLYINWEYEVLFSWYVICIQLHFHLFLDRYSQILQTSSAESKILMKHSFIFTVCSRMNLNFISIRFWNPFQIKQDSILTRIRTKLVSGKSKGPFVSAINLFKFVMTEKQQHKMRGL